MESFCVYSSLRAFACPLLEALLGTKPHKNKLLRYPPNLENHRLRGYWREQCWGMTSLIQEIMAGQVAMDDEAQTKTVTILFTELKGFTGVSAKLGI